MRRDIRARFLPAAVLMSVLLLAPACGASTRGGVYVRVGPPAPIVEARGIAPGPGHVWIAGHHQWNGGRYLWVPGRWVVPPRARATWVPGHWERTRRGWHFVEGHWR